jgi:AcrR family transcriptional regulator
MRKSSHSDSGRSSRRQPKQKRSKERVERILLAAADVFLEVGYATASTQMIADQAETAIGSIYQFFPDKLAIFHALEEVHYDRIQAMNQLIVAADIHLPLAELLAEMIQGYSVFLTHPISRCVVFQLMQPPLPGLFVRFDPLNEQNLERQSIATYADFYQRRNPNLSRAKSELLSEIAHNAFRSGFFLAFKHADLEHQKIIFQELQNLLYGYLEPHIGDRFVDRDNLVAPIAPGAQ